MTWLMLVILAAAVVAIGIMMIDRRRSRDLRQQFGPEYERAVEEHGNRRAAESALRERLDRRRSSDVHDLPPHDRERLAARWRVVQTGFVDDPQGSVAEAARLVDEAMAARGYLSDARADASDGLGDADGAVDDEAVDAGAVDGRGDRYDLVAVDHPMLVERFRNAPRVGAGTDGVGSAPALSADDLRTLFLQHHELFEALLGDTRTSRSPAVEVARS
jgi:hypothetical protein